MIDEVPPPVVETVARFGDWLAACDNWRSCEALSWPIGDESTDAIDLSFSRRSLDAPPQVTVSLARPRLFVANPGAPASVRERQLLRDTAQPVALFVDGERIDVTPAISGSHLLFSAVDQRTLWGRLPEGEALVVADEEGRPLGRASLRGLHAAMMAFTQAQTRETSPAAVNQPPADDARPGAVSSVDLAPFLAEYGCSAENDVETYRLDADHTLAFPILRCETRETGLRAAFVLGPDGLSEALFREPGVSRLSVRGPLANAGWDALDRRLSLFAEHAGEADCGVSVTYAWDGAILAAVERRELGGCTWFRRTLTTWRADVTVEVGSGQ